MVIVIIDSGVADRYTDCNKIVFPFCLDEGIPKITSGHGTAIFNIIHSECSDFAKIINFRVLNIENGINADLLIAALSYVYHNIHPDLINLSLGISECDNLQALYDVCSQLTTSGSIIVSAFDNMGSITYPAAFDNVIGVTSGKSCRKIDDFEYFEDSIINIGAKGNTQRLAWDDPPYVFLSGNSFACAHTTAKIAKMIYSSNEKLTKERILDNFKQIAIESHLALNRFIPQNLPFSISKVAIFPFSKEMQSLLRFSHLLDFEIIDVYDTKYSAKVGSTSTHLMNDENIPNYTVKNIDKIDYNSFDTLVIGHMDELSLLLRNEKIVVNLLTEASYHKKNVFIFDDVSNYGFSKCNNLYFPSVNIENIPPNRMGMLHRITTPVLGIFGTSSKQGKFTLQLKLRELLLEEGYLVGEIGTEPTAQLYGMEYVFPMGYNSTVYINHIDTINYINYAMYDLCTQKKDIIIVGSQSGTIPYDYGNIAQFPTYQYSFLLGALPDCIVLCINLFDSYEYIQRTISFIESLANTKVIALATIPFEIKENGNHSFDILKTLLPCETFFKIQKSFENQFGRPLYNITKDLDMKKLTQQIVNFFS